MFFKSIFKYIKTIKYKYKYKINLIIFKHITTFNHQSSIIPKKILAHHSLSIHLVLWKKLIRTNIV